MSLVVIADGQQKLLKCQKLLFMQKIHLEEKF